MPTATGWCRSPGRSSRPAPTASASRHSTRRSRSAIAGLGGTRHRAVSDPAGTCPRGGCRRIAVAAGDGDVLARSSRQVGRADSRPAAPELEIELEIETGLGRGGVARGGRRRRGARRSRPRPGPAWRASGRTCRRSEDRPRTAAQVERFEAAPRRARRGRDRRARGATSPRARACSRRAFPSYDAVRPGLMTYGLAARRADGRDRSPPAAARLRPVMSLVARPGSRGRPAGRARDLVRPHVRDRPAEPDRDAAAGLRRRLAAIALEPRRGARSRRAGAARRQRGDGRDACSTSPTFPGRPSASTTSSSCSARRAASGSRRPDLAQARTTNSWEVVTTTAPAASSGVRCLGRSRSASVRSRPGRIVGSDRTLERGHLRPRGRRHRERREPVAVDGDRRRRCDQAGRRRLDRVRRGPPGPGADRRCGRDAGRDARRASRSSTPCRSIATGGRTRPIIDAAVRSAFARARENRRHEHRLPGARDGRRRLSARRGGTRRQSKRSATSCPDRLRSST